MIPSVARARHQEQAPLKGVGRNLQGGVTVQLAFRRAEPAGAVHHAMRLDRIAVELAKTYFLGGQRHRGRHSRRRRLICQGEPGRAGAGHPAPARRRAAHRASYLKPFKQPFEDGFGGRIVMLHPESRGEVALASADPASADRIKQNFMSTDREWQTLRAGVKLMREILGKPSIAPFVAKELAPGSSSDADIDAHIRNTAITLHHPLGTCKMGTLMTWRWSIRNCACTVSSGCAWSTPR